MLAPLGRRETVGVVWDGAPNGEVPDARLRPLAAVLPLPPFSPAMRRFIDWVAAYTLAAPGAVLAMALAGYRRSPKKPRRSAPEQLIPDPAHVGVALSAPQAAVAEALIARSKDGFSVSLLDGVTGAGKTEVYFEAIAAALRRGCQALVLLPEIALTAQWLTRFERRFGCAPGLWHSELPPRARRITWRAVAEGKVAVVVGARSALFLPFPRLGLIVVDEEHDLAFKQEEGVIYNARDMAVVRARLTAAQAILVSATPSLESLVNAAAGRYHRITLPVRHGGARLPEVAAIDLRKAPPERGQFLSPVLLEAIAKTIDSGEQAMLFLNRRGYAPLTLCRVCGHRIACPNCSAWLVEHRGTERLICHHCGHSVPRPSACPVCGTENGLVPIGPGVERIAEEVVARFPTARTLTMASDTLVGSEAAAAAARAVTERAIDLIIGTQVIAKGWHFPYLTLVGVVDADLGLAGADLRAGERTLQLLHQVAGRAGRADLPGRVLLQTYAPEHPVMRALVAGDLEGFMAAEADARRPGHWPPFGRLAALIVSSADEAAATAAAAALGRAAPVGPGITVLGPAPAPLALLRGRYRRRLLLKTERSVMPQPILREWLARIRLSRRVTLRVDIDPTSFL